MPEPGHSAIKHAQFGKIKGLFALAARHEPGDAESTKEEVMLTGKQKRFLRALGHGLKPVIQVGKGDVSEALIRETSEALASHELIKVKILESCLIDRHSVAEELGTACQAETAQVLGRTFLLYKPAKEPKLELPKEAKAKK